MAVVSEINKIFSTLSFFLSLVTVCVVLRKHNHSRAQGIASVRLVSFFNLYIQNTDILKTKITKTSFHNPFKEIMRKDNASHSFF